MNMFKLLIVCVLLPSILTIICGTGTRAVFGTNGVTQKCVSNGLLRVQNCSTYQEDAASPPGTYLCKACQTNFLLVLYSDQTGGILTTNLGNSCFMGPTINNCAAYARNYDLRCQKC